MSGFAITIRASALPAWQRLQEALQDVTPPCAGRSEWISENAEEREYAAYRCHTCPAIVACSEFADTNHESYVWGGHDYVTPRAATPRKATA